MGSSPPRRGRRIAFWAVILVVWGLDTHGNWAGTGDEPHYAMIARSLVFDGDFDLGNDYRAPDNLVNRGGLVPEPHVRAGTNGVVRPVHDVGLPLVSVPYFAAAWGAARVLAAAVPPRVLTRARLDPPLIFRHLLGLGMIVIAAILARRLYGVLSSAESEGRGALAWTLLFVLSPPFLSHSFLFLPEIPAALIVTLACGALLSSHDLDTEATRPATQAAALGFAVGLLPLLHIRYSGLALGLAGLYLWHTARRRTNWRATASFLLPVMGILAFKVWLNLRFWGAVVTSPHVRIGLEAGVWPNATTAVFRLLALCFDRAHGLLGYAPIYLAVLPGLFVLRRWRPARWREILVLLACYLVPVALPSLNAHGWDGGWSPAGRFLVPILPLLVVGGFSYVAPLARWPVALKALATLQVVLDALYWSHPKMLWNDVDGRSALLAYVAPRGVDLSRWFPSWEDPTAYTVAVSWAVLAAWIGASAWAARRAAPPPPSPQPRAALPYRP